MARPPEWPLSVVGAQGSCGLDSAPHRGFRIWVYEKAPMVGGHSFTYNYTGEDGESAAIDMGFIFGHHRSYLNMLQLMAHTDTKVVDTELSLNVDINGKQFATDANLAGRVRIRSWSQACWRVSLPCPQADGGELCFQHRAFGLVYAGTGSARSGKSLS